MLTIEDLGVSIDGKEVLKGLNLRIPPVRGTGTGHPGIGERAARKGFGV
jgi:Fe-S cluster assembly ATPase SufC